MEERGGLMSMPFQSAPSPYATSADVQLLNVTDDALHV
jgi:hypothetical protein